MIDRVVGYVLLYSFGIYSIIAGLRGWRFPSIHWTWREMKYGEDFNKIAITLFGIILLMFAINSTIRDVLKWFYV